MAPFIALEMENRGKDSWGGTDGKEVIKRVGPILDSFEFPEHWKQAIFHTRAATVGAISERNAHPFVCIADGRKVIGIHNGHVSNYDMLKTKYQRPWAEVDSEHIFQHLAERRAMDDLFGSGTIAWFENEQPTIHLARWNYGALECANLPDGSFVFASTREAIVKACRLLKVNPSWWQLLNDGFEHKVVKDEEQKKDIIRIAAEKLGLGESYRVVSGGRANGGGRYSGIPWNSGGGYGYGYGGTANNHQAKFDKMCRRCDNDDCDSYICKKCVAKMRAEFKKMETGVYAL
jgi:hypothetical protein